MVPQWIIEKKRDGLELSDAEIRDFINGYTVGTIPDYQMSAMAMAIYLKGMTPREVATLTDVMMRSGSVVNTSSIAGLAVFPFGGWYHVSKYSVEALSDALRMELRPFGIRVSMIEPGGIKTDWGLIAADHLRESSKGTPYETVALQEADLMHKGYSSNFLSKPTRVARAIERAALSRRPRARYRLGRFSTLAVWTHRLLPTRWWDALMLRFVKIKLK